MLGLGNNLISGQAPVIGFTNTQSVAFDGVDDYISVADSNSLDATGNLTVACWTYLGDMNDEGTDVDADIFFKNGAYRAFFTRPSTLSDVYKIKVKLKPGSAMLSEVSVLSDAVSEAPSDAWIHIAVTYKEVGAGSDEVIIYKNGAAFKSVTNETIGSLANSGNALNIGGTANRIFKGKMDEFAVWNETLVADAVSAVYNSGTPFDLTEDKGNYDEYTDGLVCYLRFEGNFNDTTANNNDASVVAEASIVTAAP